jgi:ATP/ADP translocase
MLARLSIVAGDNVILLMTISLLLGHYLAVFPVVMGWGILIWLYTVITLNRYFGAATAGALHSQSNRTPA